MQVYDFKVLADVNESDCYVLAWPALQEVR
jgi:hypothetical protein